ncbi:MAG: RidA family protein [Alphaproteobacteria bacterium]|nr:RidA family protein [Alphaproteobacteria bacterium]
MTGQIDERLAKMGVKLAAAPKPAAAYVPYVKTGNLVFISGQVPFVDGELTFQGKVGVDFTLEEAQECARICALNILSVAKDACDGDLDRITRIVKLGGFVNCKDDFEQHPAVINGASNFMTDVFGEKGQHSRFAVGAGSLPFNVAVEIEAVIEIA